jgi:hypothetical protein
MSQLVASDAIHKILHLTGYSNLDKLIHTDLPRNTSPRGFAGTPSCLHLDWKKANSPSPELQVRIVIVVVQDSPVLGHSNKSRYWNPCSNAMFQGIGQERVYKTIAPG